MSMSIQDALFEQKIAENTLLTANAEKMVEVRRAQGKFLLAKEWQRRADALKRQRKELLDSRANVVVNPTQEAFGEYTDDER